MQVNLLTIECYRTGFLYISYLFFIISNYTQMSYNFVFRLINRLNVNQYFRFLKLQIFSLFKYTYK